MTLRRALLIVLLLAVSAAQSFAQTQTTPDVVGVWRGGGMTLGVGGELEIDGRQSKWHASIEHVWGFRIPRPPKEITAREKKSAPSKSEEQKGKLLVRRDKNQISVVLPSNAGEFHGWLRGQKIIGHWIQPPSEVNKNSYATPVELTQASHNLWHGQLNPLPATLSFWMSIQRAQDGSLTAVIRNPEFNLFRRNTYQVEVHGDTLVFTDAKNPNEKFEGKLKTSGEKKFLTDIQLPGMSRSTAFLSVKHDEALGFIPQLEGCDPFLYAKPKDEDDGWTTAPLTDAGLDEKPIAELIGKICHTDPIKNPFPIHSLLIARHGRLVLEEYFYGFKGEPHTMRSASKTFAPLLVGIAREKGAKIDINTPVYSQFPEYKEFANSDPRKSKISVRDLMTMTSGLACDDNDENSPGNEDVMQEQTAQPDWYKYTLDLPMTRDPGGNEAVYCSAGINLLGGIVRNATHTWLPEFFYENVAKPLQIKTYHWNLMSNGEGYAGGGLYLRPRDQLKLGQLYLNGGVWNGKRVVSKEWVEESTSRQSTFGKTLGADHDYGYGWHLLHFEVGDRSYRAFVAGGNGGQIAMVIPDLDMVVGFTGGAYGEFAKWYKWQTEVVPQFIIPAVRSTGKP